MFATARPRWLQPQPQPTRAVCTARLTAGRLLSGHRCASVVSCRLTARDAARILSLEPQIRFETVVSKRMEQLMHAVEKYSAEAGMRQAESVVAAAAASVAQAKDDAANAARSEARLQKELAETRLKAQQDHARLQRALEVVTVLLLRATNKLNMPGIIEHVEVVALEQMSVPREVWGAWTHQQIWEEMLQHPTNQEFLESLRNCVPANRGEPRQIAQRVVNLLARLSGCKHMQTSHSAVDIVEGDAVSTEDADVLVCIAQRGAVRYNVLPAESSVDGSSSSSSSNSSMIG